MPTSRTDFIPKEIVIQHETITSKRLVKECYVMSHCDETDDIPNSQISYNGEIAESQFNGGIVSLSSEITTSDNFPDILPLDYRAEWSFADNTNLINCISRNKSIFMNDIASMEVDSFCVKPNYWEMESICGDSLDTEEDISSIPEWINGSEDVWKY